MQENERDLRAFPEVWGSLSKQEKEELTYQLIKDRCTVSRQTVWNWATGKTRPSSPIIRNAVASSVNKAVGLRVSGATLFPRQ